MAWEVKPQGTAQSARFDGPDLTSNLRAWGKTIEGQAARLSQGAKELWASVFHWAAPGFANLLSC
jgi:hypothetical protein